MEFIFEIVADVLFEFFAQSKNKPIRLFTSIVSALTVIGFYSFITILSVHLIRQESYLAGSLLFFLLMLFGIGILMHTVRYINYRDIERSEVYN